MRRIAAALLLVFVFGLAVRLRADETKTTLRTTLRIGIIAFNPNNEANDDRSRTIDPLLQAYLASVTKAAVSSGVDLHFEVVRGNYYQVLRWMREGTLDGALVSPFSYHILMEDLPATDKRALLPLAVFQTPGLPAGKTDLDGNAPMFRALINGDAVLDPDRILSKCVDQLLDQQGAPCNFGFVAHLSTTGFLYPLRRIDQEIEKRHIHHESERREKDVADVMQRLLEQTRFVLWHKEEIRQDGTRLEFTYSYALLSKAEAFLTEQSKTGQKPSRQDVETHVAKAGWRPLLGERHGSGNQGAFVDDVLVLSGISTRASELREIPQFANAEKIWKPSGVEQPANPVEYTKVIAFEKGAYAGLTQDVQEVFVENGNKELWDRWYVNEHYAFSLPELVDVLKNDQRLGGRKDEAAIVLPGGGVRGAYQAVVLDALYAGHVVNVDAPGPSREKPLVISNIVGTSGGALMGYFAARIPAGKPLSERWVKDGKAAIDPAQVFPIPGAIRWFSVLAAVATLTFWVTLGWPKPPSGTYFHRGAPFLLNVAIGVVLLGTPILIKFIIANDVESKGMNAGAFYVGFVLLTHAIHSVIKPSMRNPSPIGLVLGVTAIAGGAYCAWNAVDHSYLAPCGLVLVMGGLFAIGRGLGMGISRTQMRDYALGVVLLAGFLLGTLTLFLTTLFIDQVTMVELTGQYWFVLLISATVMSAGVLWVHKWPRVEQGLLFWFRITRSKPLFYTPMATLLVAGFVGVASWASFVAPGLYDGDTGASTFSGQAEEVPRDAAARFVAALTNLGTLVCKHEDCSDGERFDRGDYYAVMPNRHDKRVDELKTFSRFLVYGSDLIEWERFLNAVSASGSPFPIYQGRELSRDKRRGIFVDGGYTHLVPVEGAVTLGAKQVLVIANKPYDEQESTSRLNEMWSLLVSDLPRTAAFLFDRAQVVDHLSGKDVLVATVAPTSSEVREAGKAANAAPFLMDFRPGTIVDLVKKAERDVAKHRPGRVTSWGQPNVILVEAHEPSKEHPKS